MYFVDKEYGIAVTCEQTAVSLCLGNDFAHFLHASRYCRERVERNFERAGNNQRQRRFSHSGRSPEDERRDAPLVNHAAYHGTIAYEMALAYVVVEGLGTKSFC